MTFITDGAVIRLIVKQELFEQALMNVFWFRWELNDGFSMDLETLTTEWWSNVNTAWKALISTDLKFTSIETTWMNQLGQPFHIMPLAQQGTLLVPSMPSSVAATFKLNVTTRVTRPGSKRLAGITEPDTDGNGYGGGFVTRANTYALLIGQNMVIENDLALEAGFLEPYVYKKTLPAFPLEFVGQKVTSASLNTNIGTQNTRKP